jgi:hypothetical protein
MNVLVSSLSNDPILPIFSGLNAAIHVATEGATINSASLKSDLFFEL